MIFSFSYLSVFSTYSRSYSVCFPFCTFYSVSHHIPGPRVCVLHFIRFSVFAPQSRSFIVCFSFCTFFQCFSLYSRSYSVCVSFFTFFGFLATILVLQCAFLIFHVFHCFSPFFRFYLVCFSFCMFFHVSHRIPGPTMIFSFSSFVSFLDISRS